MNKNLLIGAGVFVAVILVGVIIIGRPKSNPAPVASEAPQAEETEPSAEAREITISGTEYSFNPSAVTLTKGEKVRIVFMNVGAMQHDLTIEGLNLKTKTIGRGKSDTIEFTVPDSEELTFYCSISNHRALGMEGKFKIEQ